MLPQREESESMYERDASTYGNYEGNQKFPQRSDLRSEDQHLSETLGEKVYPQLSNNKNMLRIGMFIMAMVMILVCAVLFIFFLGGTGGWISFIVATGVIFLLTVIVIDKIE